MKHAYRNLRDCIYHNPLALMVLPVGLQKIAEGYIPFSTGIEIECPENVIGELHLKEIGLMAVDCGFAEQRVRLEPGIKGMIQLYQVCEVLKEYFKLNKQSGIHYHIDATTFHDQFLLMARIRENTEWVLKELDEWGYKGSFNIRMVSNTKQGWVAIRSGFGTLEFRIGEMTFDYEVMIKRIIHCQSIVKRIKQSIAKPLDKKDIKYFRVKF